MPGSLASRLASVDRLLADPPAAYRFIAERCPPGTRTIETGSGLSTVLFAALETDHICCTPGPEERERVLEYCKAHELPTEGLRFELGSSHESLPRIQAAGTEVDLALIDGSHGFPLPVVDWFYSGAMLRTGGVVLVDDVNLPAVRTLLDFVDRDPRWRRLSDSPKWAAFERTGRGPLAEDWTAQPFYVHRPAGVRGLAQRVRGRIRRELAGRARRSPTCPSPPLSGRNRTP